MKAIEAFRYNVQRSRNLVQIYNELRESGRQHRHTSDLLRAGYVLAVGALDAYIHDKISENIVDFIKSSCVQKDDRDPLNHFRSKLNQTLNLDVLLTAATKDRPFVLIRKHFNAFFYEKSFQNPHSIADAAKYIGLSKLWESLAQRLETDEKVLKDEVAAYATRRNQIVHEGDRQHSRRNRHQRRNITVEFVNASVESIETVVTGIDAIIDEHLKPYRRKLQAHNNRRTRARRNRVPAHQQVDTQSDEPADPTDPTDPTE